MRLRAWSASAAIQRMQADHSSVQRGAEEPRSAHPTQTSRFALRLRFVNDSFIACRVASPPEEKPEFSRFFSKFSPKEFMRVDLLNHTFNIIRLDSTGYGRPPLRPPESAEAEPCEKISTRRSREPHPRRGLDRSAAPGRPPPAGMIHQSPRVLCSIGSARYWGGMDSADRPFGCRSPQRCFPGAPHPNRDRGVKDSRRSIGPMRSGRFTRWIRTADRRGRSHRPLPESLGALLSSSPGERSRIW